MTKAYLTELLEVQSIVFSKSPGRARYVTAMSAYDAGYIDRANPALIKCRRYPSLDQELEKIKIDHCYGLDFFINLELDL